MLESYRWIGSFSIVVLRSVQYVPEKQIRQRAGTASEDAALCEVLEAPGGLAVAGGAEAGAGTKNEGDGVGASAVAVP